MVEEKGREKIIVRASVLGILMNFLLVLGKAGVGLVSGSVSIILDAVNNLTDILSSVVTLAGIKLAGKRPDREHPYGHGRVEYLAAVGVGLVILFAGVGALVESVPKIFEPKLAEYSMATVIVVSLAVIIKLIFGGYVRRKGEEVKSRSLVATGVDAFYDAMLSLGTLVGILVSLIFKVSIDGLVGVVIGLFIVRASLEILGEGWTEVIGRRVDAGLTRKVRRAILGTEGVEGVLELKLHSYGPMKIIGAAKIEVPDSLSARELKVQAAEIEKKIEEEFGVEIIVGV